MKQHSCCCFFRSKRMSYNPIQAGHTCIACKHTAFEQLTKHTSPTACRKALTPTKRQGTTQGCTPVASPDTPPHGTANTPWLNQTSHHQHVHQLHARLLSAQADVRPGHTAQSRAAVPPGVHQRASQSHRTHVHVLSR
jgi:hypothetical protein